MGVLEAPDIDQFVKEKNSPRLSRRKFLVGLGVLGVSGLVASLLPSGEGESVVSQAEPDLEASPDVRSLSREKVQALAEKIESLGLGTIEWRDPESGPTEEVTMVVPFHHPEMGAGGKAVNIESLHQEWVILELLVRNGVRDFGFDGPEADEYFRPFHPYYDPAHGSAFFADLPVQNPKLEAIRPSEVRDQMSVLAHFEGWAETFAEIDQRYWFLRLLKTVQPEVVCHGIEPVGFEKEIIADTRRALEEGDFSMARLPDGKICITSPQTDSLSGQIQPVSYTTQSFSDEQLWGMRALGLGLFGTDRLHQRREDDWLSHNRNPQVLCVGDGHIPNLKPKSRSLAVISLPKAEGY